jgi:hypothetical protein
MKKLKSNLLQFPTKQRLGHSRIVSLPVQTDRPQPSVAVTAAIPKREHHAIPPLQPQIAAKSPPSDRSEWQHLAAQADRINQLAAELEAAIFKLKAIGDRIDYTQAASQSVCEYRTVVVPHVKRHKATEFILTTKVIDLFQAETEAQQLAQTLRQKTKSSRRKPHLLSWLL